MKLSVIICTYNPNESVFSKCLKTIIEAAKQYIPHEVIIIDNNSTSPLSQEIYIRNFLKEQSNARIVVETKQGLTPARLRGIKESSGDILLFIDDDNFIQEDFFTKGIAIAAEFKHVGSWSGQVKLVFEKEPEAWTKKYWGMLVYREFNRNYWSNFPHMPETMPCGAGLFVRKEVGIYYEQLHQTGKRNIQLDRTGSSLFSGGDNDLAACACDIGMGVGLFHELKLNHYIPEKRLRKEYLLELTEGISASAIVFKSFRGEFSPPLTLKNKIANTIRSILKSDLEKEFFKAELKGQEKGKRMLASNHLPN